MARAFVPELCDEGASSDCTVLDNRYTKSAYFNPMYYNPAVTYPPPRNNLGVELATTFKKAYRNGFDPGGKLGTVDLSTNYRPTAYVALAGNNSSEGFMNHFSAGSVSDVKCSSSKVCSVGNSAGTQSCKKDEDCLSKGVPAYYYVFNSSNKDCTKTVGDQAKDNDCYTLTLVGAAEQQNFANWFSFARTRNFATQTAASVAFSSLDPSVRVSWQALNTCNGGGATNLVTSNCAGWKQTGGTSNAIKPFTSTHKSNFYSWLFQIPTSSGTPLLDAMSRAGNYYSTSGDGSPYDTDFGAAAKAGDKELTCRRNYHVMMTDGIWNSSVSKPGNIDNSRFELPDKKPYEPRSPYRDETKDSLSDVAFKYWSTDLRKDLSDDLLGVFRDTSDTTDIQYWNSRNDPATWQHMVNFNIGLGLTSFLSSAKLKWTGDMYGGSYQELVSGTQAWPTAFSSQNNAGNVADLWHAAINSRGQFFSADDPASLTVAFRAALTAITGDTGSAAALSANSTSLQPGSTLVYQARFNKDWSGALIALPIKQDGTVDKEKWDSSKLIPAPNRRNIFTHNGKAGAIFSTCEDLSVSQRDALNKNAGGVTDNKCDARLQWLRGDDSQEIRKPNGIFRNRLTSVMGDIINSDPAYVRDVDYNYSALPSGIPEQSGYAKFLADNAKRTPMVYVGANDGKMYGIRGDVDQPDSGKEIFSYIPGGVYSNLSYLTDPSYSHRYYVDGGITVGDAYLGGAWKTVLLGGLNGGGKTIYALDITNPDAFDASKVLWEFDVDDDAELGLTYSRPQIGILESGQWVAVFGNGYNSSGGGAHLYVVDLYTGKLLKRITAEDGSGDDNNGLSTPFLYDADKNHLIDSAYAGDLRGNLWKFDLSKESGNLAYGSPLFKAVLDSQEQPITAQPQVTAHPSGGNLVLFGTGRYLTNGDITNDSIQSFYGIWDNGAVVTRRELKQQKFDVQTEKDGRSVRSVKNESVNWGGSERGWYLDLIDANGSKHGERVVNTSLVKLGRVIFGSIIPSTDECKPGGTSWLIELKLATGGGFNNSILDLNNDGLFDEGDGIKDTDGNDRAVNAVSNDNLGISNIPVWIEGKDAGYKIRTGTTGNFGTESNCLQENEELCKKPPPAPSSGVTRRSWIQIR
jgi:type IV pilus assembly protein PilY1